ESIAVVQRISGEKTINALGFCVGGTILCTALAALAAKGRRPVESLTLLTTLLDFADPGTLGVFVDEMQVALREQTIGSGGILPGKDLATTFSTLRPNDLVWNYVVANYLKGEAPPPFDLLYWNADSTNLPGPMFCWYLRHTYLQNELREPGRLTCLDEPIDLRAIAVPTYVLCAQEDHIVPWQAGFASAQALGGTPRFVVGASGHIAGVINPPIKNKRSYRTGPAIAGLEPGDWLAKTTEQPGSWWTDWSKWLAPHQGSRVAPPRMPGNAEFAAIEPAPGRYVKEPA
ncbi:MAG: alpha/beta fold hydrolase, partial [Lautropia sp.]